jgi:hypothetical protein
MNPETGKWFVHTEGQPVHVWPRGDLIEHDADDDDAGCLCGPTVEPVPRPDGSIGWLIIHHALDGRE